MFRLILNDRELRVLVRLLDGMDDDGDTEARQTLAEKADEILGDNIDALERIQDAQGT